MRTPGGGGPSVDYVASYLIDAARQESSVWTVVNVIKHYLDDGLVKRDALRAVTLAEQRATPELLSLITLYRAGIKQIL